MSNTLQIDDALRYSEVCKITGDRPRIKTDIQMGYGLYKDENGISQLGEVVLSHLHNKFTVGGINYLLEKVFGVNGNIDIKNLNDKYEIGKNVSATNIDGKGSRVFLFNMGLDGCGAAYTDIKDVLDQQNDIVPIAEENLFGSMVPFRVVDEGEPVSDNENGGPYWFKKTVETEVADGGKIRKDWYFLKEFEEVVDVTAGTNPTIINRWKDNGTDDGTLVTDNPENSVRTEGIESYAEIILRVKADDLREYFGTYQKASDARFNSIGLCCGTKSTVYNEDNTETYTEYTDVRQISVYNFSNEMLHFDKDITIIYRIYLS